MDKLAKEIAKVLYRISNDLIDSYYGIGSYPFKVEEYLLGHKAVWTEEGWECPKNLDIESLGICNLPKIKSIGGHFTCSGNLLQNLKGCPKEIFGNFYCEYNLLDSLEGGPEKITGYYDCSHNKLTTLQYSPLEVGTTFKCNCNNLSTLEHNRLKKVLKGFCCTNNLLKNLKGSPEQVGTFDCSQNLLETLEGCPTEVRDYFICGNNPKLRSLDFLPVNRGCVVLSDLGNRYVTEGQNVV